MGRALAPKQNVSIYPTRLTVSSNASPAVAIRRSWTPAGSMAGRTYSIKRNPKSDSANAAATTAP